MINKNEEFSRENEYLEKVIAFLKDEISNMKESIDIRRNLLYRERRELGVFAAENRSSGINADISQHVDEDKRQLESINMMAKLLERDQKLVPSPYFGRFDFKEDGERIPEKFYIGIHNLYDENASGDILVYDWRAPVCSVYYRNETGRAGYKAPDGVIEGDVTLKRQYKIENSKLKYFFDSSLVINDEVLQQALAGNASEKMRNVVKTIQREQDMIIRDTKSDLLIAQGSAGSGKTTIAMHRIAYLLYNSAMLGLSSKNIAIISLNDIFSRYIGAVLPQLGEENVNELTFGDIEYKLTGYKAGYERVEFADKLLSAEKRGESDLPESAMLFKCSLNFAKILEKFLYYYENNVMRFPDISYCGKDVMSGEKIRETFLDNKIDAPILSRLRRIETMLKSRIDAMQPEMHRRLEEKYKVIQEHRYDYKSVARLEAVKETEKVFGFIENSLRLNAFDVYRELFSDLGRFKDISAAIKLPDNINDIFGMTYESVKSGPSYDDMAALAYLSLMMGSAYSSGGIKHVVVDEAQDYLPMHYALLTRLFPHASYTVLGDIFQSVETNAGNEFYSSVAGILNKKNPVILKLKKSYRSSREITDLAMKIPQVPPEIIPFDRHEETPCLIRCSDDDIPGRVAADVRRALDEGFSTAAVICATTSQARRFYEQLSQKMRVTLLEKTGEVKSGVLVLPAYLSKGLEFDCVFIPYVRDENYGGKLSRKLFYISCTRALHRLCLYYDREDGTVKRLKQ